MNNWERWCLGLTVREKRKLICGLYDDCYFCPLDEIDDCSDDYQVGKWFDKTVENKGESEDKE